MENSAFLLGPLLEAKRIKLLFFSTITITYLFILLTLWHLYIVDPNTLVTNELSSGLLYLWVLWRSSLGEQRRAKFSFQGFNLKIGMFDFLSGTKICVQIPKRFHIEIHNTCIPLERLDISGSDFPLQPGQVQIPPLPPPGTHDGQRGGGRLRLDLDFELIGA